MLIYFVIITYVLSNIFSLGYCVKGDCYNGYGTKNYFDDRSYTGNWKMGFHHGQGTLIDADGDKYVGNYENNKRHGQGTYTYASGGKYVGNYENGKKHGQGTYTWTDGEKYVGNYENGKKHGQGTYTWADGEKYVGNYVNGKYHGQGIFTYTNGDKYEGEFKSNRVEGEGRYTLEDGSSYFGEWKSDVYDGYGVLNHNDGIVMAGAWDQGEPSDVTKWLLIHSDEISQKEWFYKADSVEKRGDYLYAVDLDSYSKTSFTNDIEIDCKQARARPLTMSIYSKTMAMGEIMDSVPAPTMWIDFDKTPKRILFEVLCEDDSIV